jgi:hypothetical protein
MTKLSANASAILKALRENAESETTDKAGRTWHSVYIDNARPSGMNVHMFAGYLSALEAAGYYRPDSMDTTSSFGLVLAAKGK